MPVPTPKSSSPPIGSLPGEIAPTEATDLPTGSQAVQALGAVLRSEFDHAESIRKLQEEVWLQNLRQYKGKYDPEVLVKMHPARSKAFIRLTRVKVRGMDARMGKMLFPAGEKNWGLDAPSIDDLDPAKHMLQLAQAMARHGITDQNALNPEQVKQMLREVADKARKSMEGEIEDQLDLGGYRDVSRDVLHSGHLYGTGILKGPLSHKKIIPNWELKQMGQAIQFAYAEKALKTPFFEMRPVWNVYPDPEAVTLADCEYIWDRLVQTKKDLRQLAKRRGFDQEIINQYIQDNPNGDSKMRWWEVEMQNLGERYNVGQVRNRYDLLERWGMLTGQQLRDQCGMMSEIPESEVNTDFECTVYLLGLTVVKASILKADDGRRPWNFYYPENDESSIWGTSVSELYRDPQTLFNSAVRVAIDNAALAGGPQIEVNRELMDDEDDVESIFPFRVWVRNGIGPEANAPALRVYPIASYVEQNMGLASSFKEMGDEVSGVQSYTYGEPGKNVANTVGGMSMLMGQSNITIEDNVKNWDDQITKPFITGMYNWNMQNNPRDEIKGDLTVKALGVSSLVAKELRAHAVQSFRSTTANPMDAPFTNRKYMLRQEAIALDLDADRVVPDEFTMDDLPPRPPAPLPCAVAPPGAVPGMAPPGAAVASPDGSPAGAVPPAAAQQGVTGQQAAEVASQ